jgi:hypothetical protein
MHEIGIGRSTILAQKVRNLSPNLRERIVEWLSWCLSGYAWKNPSLDSDTSQDAVQSLLLQGEPVPQIAQITGRKSLKCDNLEGDFFQQ